ncbi:MAG: transposase [Bacteroidetes bacterium]|nr:transposase [Bacteroidota bacterium]
MKFIAIDVETANADMASICQIGIAWYEAGALVKEWKSYVDPLDYFDPANVAIHGIDEKAVHGSQPFSELAQEIFKYIDQQVVVSHTHFDRVALIRAYDKYETNHPECTWLDSVRIARHTWEQFSESGYGLENVCNYLGYEFDAHDALEDAKAAGYIILTAIKHSETDLETLVNKSLQRQRKKFRRQHYRAKGLEYETKLVIKWGDLESDLESDYYIDDTDEVSDVTKKHRFFGEKPVKRMGNPYGPLYGEILVFTGALDIPRHKAADMAAAVGCRVEQGVTKKTTLLVVGDQDIAILAGHKKSSKHRKAEKLIEKGIQIRILKESDFKRLIELDKK